MRRFALIPSCLTLFGAALALPYAAIADEPLAPYEGRPLPPLVKELLWSKACDIPQAEAENDTCRSLGDPGVCKFERSNGNPYKPQLAPWMDLTMFQWATGANALQPALIQGKLASADELDGDARLAISIASGLTVDVDTSDQLVQLNPLLVRWVMREVLPPPEQPMCGKTAKELYQAAFSGPTRVMVDVYTQLKAKGALRGTKRADVEKAFNDQKGRLATMCQSIAKKTKVPDEEWPRAASCWWWLRRAASGGTDELALLMAKAMRDYDPTTYKTYASSLPRELR